MDEDCSLAGLSFRFSPVALKAPPASRGRSGTGAAGPARGSGGGGADRAPGAASPLPPSRAVVFNMRERRAGAAYGSPEAQLANAAESAEPQPAEPLGRLAAGRGALPRPEPSTAGSLAQLKLASLRRRAAAAAMQAERAYAAEVLEPVPAAAAAAAATPARCHGAAGADVEPASVAAVTLAADMYASSLEEDLLQDLEGMLAGCASATVDNPPPSTPLPSHVLLGLPVLAVPPQTAAAAAAVESAESGWQCGDRLAAYRPVPSSSGCPVQPAHAPAAVLEAAAADGTRQPSQALADLPEAVAAGAGPPACLLDAKTPPVTLQQALRCLHLLAHQHSGEDAASNAASRSNAPGQGGAQQHWVRLRAVQVVVATKQQAAAAAELVPLVRRLRQVRLHLEFHKANLQRGRSRSPRRSTSPAAVPPAGPWLSGRSSAQDSKHRRSRSGSPGLQPRPKASGPTAEASELQVQLLTSLLHKLLLKLGLGVLRQAAAAARLRSRLLVHVHAQAEADTCCAVLQHWLVEAVPSQQQKAAGAWLAAELCLRRQRVQLEKWRHWAAHSIWQQQQLAQGQQELRRRLLAAGVRQWRCYCQQQLVRRLQAAMAARWLAAWSRRRVFVAWRQAARRSGQLRAALLLGRSVAACSVNDVQLPGSQLEALAATAAAFAPVKAFVAEAAQQLRQLQQGLRFCVSGSRMAAATRATAAKQLLGPAEQQEPLPVGSVEALLALLPPKQQQQQPARVPPAAQDALAKASAAASVLRLPPAGELHATAAAAAGAGSSAVFTAVAPVRQPAPDPGSPPAAAYNPASYASPHQARTEEQQQGRRQGRAAAHVDSARMVEPPEPVEAELSACQEQVLQLRRELEKLEQESASLQQQCSQLEEAGAVAQQAEGRQRQSCFAAATNKEAAAAVMQDAVQQFHAAAAECALRERQLKQQQQASQEALAAAAGARGAVHALAERQAVSAMAVQRWSKAVEVAAKELTTCHRSQQAPVVVRLREARQQLERHQVQAAAARQQAPELQAAADEAARHAQQAQQAVLEAQQQLVAAAEQRAAGQQQLDAAMARHEAAAVAFVVAEQEASALEQRKRLAAAQQQAAAAQLQQAAQQVLRKQEEAVQLQQQVELLQQRHQEAVAAALSAGQEHQRRSKLKRRLQMVQEEVEAPLASPSAVHQRRPAPSAAGGVAATASWPAAAAAGAVDAEQAGPEQHAGLAASEPGQLALHVPQLSSWSCCSSELGSPLSEPAPPPPPLTVEEAATRFYCRCLLHRALHIMHSEAHTTRTAMAAAAGMWQQRQQAAVLRAWHVHAVEAAGWLHEASMVLRRRWLLRQWRAIAADRMWQREAEAESDAFARHRLLVTGVQAWRQHLRHEHWRDDAHEAVVHLRMRNMLQSWRLWTRRRRQKAARLRAALSVYHTRLLGAAIRQWRWVQGSKALLHRVFSTAVELWQEEVGVRLHERNHERLQACWGAWQLAVLEAQALRRQAILWNAAAAFREKQLLLSGLQAFRQALACAREQRQLARLQSHMFAEWRHLAACSPRHWHYEAARRQRKRHLMRAALVTWRSAAEATSELLARFWLRWQVQALLRRSLLGWRWTVQAQHEARILSGMADVHRERRLQQLGLEGFAANMRAGSSAGGGGSSMRRDSSQDRSCRQLDSPKGRGRSGGQNQARGRQQAAGRHVATVSVSVGRRHESCRQIPAPAGSTTTIVISRGPWHLAGQEQVPPAVDVGSGGLAAADPTWAVAGGPTAAAAAQGMLDAVSSWRAAADYWRQRHQSYGQQGPQQQQQQQQLAAVAPVLASITPRTAATLAELRARQHQWR